MIYQLKDYHEHFITNKRITATADDVGYKLLLLDTRQDPMLIDIANYHHHAELEFLFVKKGTVSIKTSTQTIALSEGDGCYINANVTFQFIDNQEQENTLYFYIIHRDFLGGTPTSIIDYKYLYPICMNKDIDCLALKRDDPNCYEILILLQNAWEFEQTEPHCRELQVRVHLTKAWMILYRYLKSQDKLLPLPKADDLKRLNAMIAYIYSNYEKEISVQEIASSVSVSTKECTRSFKQYLDKTPLDFLNAYRLKMASFYLLETEKSLIEITHLCGYYDQSHFTKSFKKEYLSTPTQYRKLHLKQP